MGALPRDRIVIWQPEHTDSTQISKLTRAFPAQVLSAHTIEGARALLGDLNVALESPAWAPLEDYELPDGEVNVTYWVGSTNGTLPEEVLDLMDHVIKVETTVDRALAPVTALAIVMHARAIKHRIGV